MSSTNTKTKRCKHCRKPFSYVRASKQFCCTACKKAYFDRAISAEPPAAKKRREDSLKLASHPLFQLRQSDFIKHLLQQIVRHGSIDCLLDFPIEQLFDLYKSRGFFAYVCKTPIHIAHLQPCVNRNGDRGAYHPDNLSLLPARLNQSQGNRMIYPVDVGLTFTPASRCATEDEVWQQLVHRYRDKLTAFAKQHAKLKGMERVKDAAKLLSDPRIDIRGIRSILNMEPANYSAMCKRLQFTPTAYSYPERSDFSCCSADMLAVYVFHLHRIARYLDRAQCYQFAAILCTFTTSTPALIQLCDKACSGLLSEALTDLIKLYPEQHKESLMSDNLFITSDIDGSNIHVMTIGDDTAPTTIDTLPEWEQQSILRSRANAQLADSRAAKCRKLAHANKSTPLAELEKRAHKFSDPCLYIAVERRLTM